MLDSRRTGHRLEAWMLTYKEGELKQAEACRKESIDMKLHGTFRLGMPNE
jgi:hypothetical protein